LCRQPVVLQLDLLLTYRGGEPLTKLYRL
jgi:hypothetical protein